MLRLPPFRYVRPESVAEAAKVLAEHPGESMVLAGGTDLLPNLKRRQFDAKVLVAVGHLAELQVFSSNGEMSIGGGMKLSDVAALAETGESAAGLSEAIRKIANPQIQRQGTIGGNLCVDTRCNYYNQNYEWRKSINFCMKKDGEICWVAPSSPRCWAVSSSDTAPVLMVLDAECTLVGPRRVRRVPVKSLYHLDGIDFLKKERDEILTEIHVPKSNGMRATYLKLRRRDSIDFPILGVAAAIETAKDGTVEKARIVLTAVESAPVQAEKAEALLVGKKLTEEWIDEAAAIAYRPAKPLDNTDLTHAYRKKMARVFVARALRELSRG